VLRIDREWNVPRLQEPLKRDLWGVNLGHQSPRTRSWHGGTMLKIRTAIINLDIEGNRTSTFSPL